MPKFGAQNFPNGFAGQIILITKEVGYVD